MTERQRIESVLHRRIPDRVPWATRLDLWYESHRAIGDLPPGLNEMEIYSALGIGRQSYVHLVRERLVGVEVRAEFNGSEFYHQVSPVLGFPGSGELVPLDAPGQTRIEYRTPAGNACVRLETSAESLASFASPYTTKHLVASESDLAVASWILDHSVPEPDYEPFLSRERQIGDNGFTIAILGRTPFQRLLLDYCGVEQCFYFMADHPRAFGKLYDQLAESTQLYLSLGLQSPAFMLEFGDNYDGRVTSPRLFAEFCLEPMQRYSERVHAAGKVLGSHMDGDLTGLVELIPETGIDVVESFSPRPLTQLGFQTAWKPWRNRVIPWGILASPLFEATTAPSALETEVTNVIQTILPDGLAILGIGDQAVRCTLPERVRRASELIEMHGLYPPASAPGG